MRTEDAHEEARRQFFSEPWPTPSGDTPYFLAKRSMALGASLMTKAKQKHDLPGALNRRALVSSSGASGLLI